MPMLMLDSGVRHGGSVLRRPREAIPIQVACESPARECLLSLRAVGQAPSGHLPDCIKIMVRTVTLQITAAFSETSYELSPLHSEIAISCLSFGTNVLSAASSTISR